MLRHRGPNLNRTETFCSRTWNWLNPPTSLKGHIGPCQTGSKIHSTQWPLWRATHSMKWNNNESYYLFVFIFIQLQMNFGIILHFVTVIIYLLLLIIDGTLVMFNLMQFHSLIRLCSRLFVRFLVLSFLHSYLCNRVQKSCKEGKSASFGVRTQDLRGIKLKLFNAARYQNVSRACAGHYLVYKRATCTIFFIFMWFKKAS